ncbi:MAG TPA: DUF4157 domain-containing protein, partial [Longimicrobium sp.]|nr:DUF4157 domain-containing protein [Longimicrobium sp.]
MLSAVRAPQPGRAAGAAAHPSAPAPARGGMPRFLGGRAAEAQAERAEAGFAAAPGAVNPAASAAPVAAATAPPPGLGGGAPLEPGVRGRYEGYFGRPLGHVRVHDGPAADRSARLNLSRAYARGSHLVFARGALDAASPAGGRLLAHELAHVVQHDGAGDAARVDRKTAEEWTDEYTDWNFLDHGGLGRALAGLLPGGAAEVQAVIDYQGWTDEDDVAGAVAAAATDDQLRGAGTGFLDYLIGRMGGGWTAGDEYRGVGRLRQLRGELDPEAEPAEAPAALADTPAQVIDAHTRWGDLKEGELGATLAARVVSQPALVIGVLDALGSGDRDDVAEAIVEAVPAHTLARCSDTLLQRLRSELEGRIFAWTADSESEAMGRLDAAIRRRSVDVRVVAQAPAT